MSAAGTARDIALDRLRATAIALVVVSHVAQMWPTEVPQLTRVTVLGAYGVDLFFVLSGWLVGGLYWKELARHGNVEIGRFILRRILRTVPCYLIALGLAWGAVRVTDPQRGAFDWRYLVFLQNYEATMPYFLVSWSLCIEEHFYLALPVVMTLLFRDRPKLVVVLWPVCLVPLVLRTVTHPQVIGSFGFDWTATHLRFEGLLAGVLAARIFRQDGPAWDRLVVWSRLLVVPALAAGIAMFYWSRMGFYIVGLACLAGGFLCLLVALVGAQTRTPFADRFVTTVAVGSYSVYLTHALMIHAARRVIGRLSITSNSTRLLIFATAITAGAAVFYGLVERPAMAARDRWVPAR